MRLSMDMALLYAIPAVANTVIKGALSGDLDDRDRLKKHLTADFISQSGGTLVDFASWSPRARRSPVRAAAATRARPRFASSRTSGASRRKRITTTPSARADEGFLHALIDTGGILFHYPAAQVNRTWRAIEALHNGDTTSPGVLLTGPQPKD